MDTTIDLLTVEEFLARPDREDCQREELIEGELLVSPSPKVSHAAMVVSLAESLANLKQQGYVQASDFGCILGKSLLTPDLSAVRTDRWQTAAKNKEWLEGSPELVIEVASPTNRRLHHKAEVFLEFGAEQVWIVYPRTQTVTVMTQEGTREARMGEAVEFHGVRVPVELIFPA